MPETIPTDSAVAETEAEPAAALEHVLFEVRRVIVGQDDLLERLVVAVLARGHCLLEGPPGVAKTLAAQTLASVCGGSFARIQFTPDLVPSDLVGTRIYRMSREEFDIETGPVFAHFVLADEINRAPAKVQSALLEAMAERQVSLGGRTFALPDPFTVLATQNPLESDGVYPLPAAQLDRFLLKVQIGFPTSGEEGAILSRMGREEERYQVTRLLDPAAMRSLQQRAERVFVHPAIAEYVIALVVATRDPASAGLPDLVPVVEHGASSRASLGLVRAGRALALLRGRDYVLPEDVADLAADVIAHRLGLSFDASVDGVSSRHVVDRVLGAVAQPRIAPARGGEGGTDAPGHRSVAAAS